MHISDLLPHGPAVLPWDVCLELTSISTTRAGATRLARGSARGLSTTQLAVYFSLVSTARKTTPQSLTDIIVPTVSRVGVLVAPATACGHKSAVEPCCTQSVRNLSVNMAKGEG